LRFRTCTAPAMTRADPCPSGTATSSSPSAGGKAASSGRVFLTDARDQRTLPHDWIISVIEKQHLVEIDQINGFVNMTDTTAVRQSERQVHQAIVLFVSVDWSGVVWDRFQTAAPAPSGGERVVSRRARATPTSPPDTPCGVAFLSYERGCIFSPAFRAI